MFNVQRRRGREKKTHGDADGVERYLPLVVCHIAARRLLGVLAAHSHVFVHRCQHLHDRQVLHHVLSYVKICKPFQKFINCNAEKNYM